MTVTLPAWAIVALLVLAVGALAQYGLSRTTPQSNGPFAFVGDALGCLVSTVLWLVLIGVGLAVLLALEVTR